MSIRRKSTTHDLATLRLHPDGSRVQQSSANARHRTAGSTVVDARGNWIAKDAGGKSSVKKRRKIHTSYAGGDDDEYIDLSGGEERAHSQSKGKQRARDGQTPDEDSLREPGSERFDTRTRQRLSFTRDLSFLDPPPVSVSSLEQDTDHADAASAGEPVVSFSDPAPVSPLPSAWQFPLMSLEDLLKSIHHFASCHYRERGQLSDSSREYRGKKKERYQQSQRSIHTLAANALEHQDSDAETLHTETEDESTEEDEDEDDAMDDEDKRKGGPGTKRDTYRKDMYKAFDGSALMAIGPSANSVQGPTQHIPGIVLQEYVAYVLSSRPRNSGEHPSPEGGRTE